MKITSAGNIFRQSHVILVMQLVGVELVLVLAYMLVRLPKFVLLNSSSSSDWFGVVNLASFVYFFVLSIVELVLVLKVVLDWVNDVYEIREGSIVHRRGVLRTDEDNYSLRNLGSVQVNQGLLGKIFNFGTITLYSPTLKQEFYLNSVHNPSAKLKLLEDELGEASGKQKLIVKKN